MSLVKQPQNSLSVISVGSNQKDNELGGNFLTVIYNYE